MEKTRYYSVTQLNNYIKGVFEDELILQNITVVGEVYECSEAGGNIYIVLRDEKSLINCIHFGRDVMPSVGEKVLVTGSVRFYAKSGKTCFHVKSVAPFGEGSIKKRLDELKTRLQKEGLFDNKLALPVFIRRIALVTSENGAVLHDFVGVLLKAHSYIDITVFNARVQGDGAEESLAQAIGRANLSGNFDVLVIARGGGSDDDLRPFNTECVARAVYGSAIPVISSVGHEINYTLCDFCASLRAGTPSIAAENVCRINERFIAEYRVLLGRLSTAVRTLYDRVSSKTAFYAKKLTDEAGEAYYSKKLRLAKAVALLTGGADNAVSAAEMQIDRTVSSLSAAANRLVEKREQALMTCVERLNAKNPLSVLSSGYSKVYANGKDIASARDVGAGDELTVYMKDGVVYAKTLSVKITEGED